MDDLLARLSAPSATTSDFDLNADVIPAPGRALRDAAVLVALRDAPGGPEVLLTKRASHLRHHPGQIAFPGGKIDAGDASPAAAALREAHEECGLPAHAVTVHATLASHETVTAYTITPVLARITAPFTPRPEPGEVEEIFFVPLAHVLDPARFTVQTFHRGTQERRYYAVPWGPYYIWGATARILRGLADRAQ